MKAVLAVSIVTNLGLLAVFKYTGFVAENVNALGARCSASATTSCRCCTSCCRSGISFYTFKAMSYAIDVYRGDARPDAPLHRLHVLRGVLPRSGRGPDHPLRRARRADARPRSTRSTSSRAASPSSRSAWPRRSSSRTRWATSPTPRSPRAPLHCARRLVRRVRLRVPDLLRLLRLLRHGGRARADDGLRPHPELRLALQGRQHHRLLAALAHQPVDLAARLPLHPARRQPPAASGAPTST